MTIGQEFFQELVGYRSSLNVEAFFNMYHEDLVKVGFGSPIEDKEAFRSSYSKLASGYELYESSLDYFTATDDVIIYKGTMKTNHGVMKPNEAFYLKDVKVYRHIVFTLPPEQVKAWALAGVTPPTAEKTGEMTPAEKFYQDHIGYIAKGDIDGLLEDHYHDDIEMVTFEFTLKGKQAIRDYLQEWPQLVGNILGLSTDYFAASDDVILFKASIATEKFGVIKADDAFYLIDGKIHRHMALTIPPSKTKEWAMK